MTWPALDLTLLDLISLDLTWLDLAWFDTIGLDLSFDKLQTVICSFSARQSQILNNHHTWFIQNRDLALRSRRWPWIYICIYMLCYATSHMYIYTCICSWLDLTWLTLTWLELSWLDLADLTWLGWLFKTFADICIYHNYIWPWNLSFIITFMSFVFCLCCHSAG